MAELETTEWVRCRWEERMEAVAAAGLVIQEVEEVICWVR
jgi:hypothetical protein